MSQFKGNAEDSFGFVAGLGHLLIALGVIAAIIGLLTYLFVGTNDLVELMLGVGTAGVFSGIGLGFINILFN